MNVYNAFSRDFFLPYCNFHRPCAFPRIALDPTTGKKTIAYPQENSQTPYQKLLSLARYKDIVPESTRRLLNEQYLMPTPHQAAERMQRAKKELLSIVTAPPPL